jgi:predicted porin
MALLAGPAARLGAVVGERVRLHRGAGRAADAERAGTQLFDMGGSRLGFKGDEDLGDGMKASFYLEHRFNPDTGTLSAPDTFWKGGSWVGLSSETLGSVKVGRWWSQAFLKSQYAADPFGMLTLGEGTYGSVGCGPAFSGGCLGAFWVNNAVSYENAIGGFSFGAQYAAEAVGPGGKHPANLGLSYADGGLYLGAGHEVSNDGSSAERWSSLAATYDFGPVKLHAGYGFGQDAAKVSRKNAIVGFNAPVGAGALIGSFDAQEQAGVRVEQLLSLATSTSCPSAPTCSRWSPTTTRRRTGPTGPATRWACSTASDRMSCRPRRGARGVVQGGRRGRPRWFRCCGAGGQHPFCQSRLRDHAQAPCHRHRLRAAVRVELGVVCAQVRADGAVGDERLLCHGRQRMHHRAHRLALVEHQADEALAAGRRQRLRRARAAARARRAIAPARCARA